MVTNTPNFLKNINTGDESWCFAYDPETKRQSAQWVGENSPRPKKLRFQKSKIKTTLIVFFDSQGIIHNEFVPREVLLMPNSTKKFWIASVKGLHALGPLCGKIGLFSCCTITLQHTPRRLSLNFWPKK